MQAIAFMVVTDENMIQVRDALRIEEKSTQDKSKKKIHSIVLQIRI
jgi:hypothetical protein